MRILFDHQAFSLQNTGGITRYFYELIRRMSRVEGVEPVTLLGYSSTAWPMNEVSGPNSRLFHFGPRVLSSGPATYLTNEIVLGSLALGLGGFDVYHNTLYRFMPTVRARRRVATHHDCIQERFPEFYHDNDRIMRIKRGMFSRADLVICVSESSRRDLQEFYDVETSRTLVIHHGVEALPRSESGKAELSRMGLRPFILYVGLRGLYKNFSGLLKAMSKSGVHRDFDLLAIGGGPIEDAERGAIHDLGLSTAVKIVPKASAALLAEAYATAALFVYPSLYEGFGMPPLEAMSAGCPTLVSRTAATVEVCKDATTFFDPHDDEAFCQSLRSSLMNESSRQERVARGIELAGTYTWDACVGRTLNGYRSLL